MGFKTWTDAIPNALQTELKFAGPSIIVAILLTWSLLLTLEPTGGAVVAPSPLEVFLSFLPRRNKISAPGVFSSCAFIHCTHFETSLMMDSYLRV